MSQPGPTEAPPQEKEWTEYSLERSKQLKHQLKSLLLNRHHRHHSLSSFTEDDYKNILLSSYVEAMEPVANDPQVMSALQEQVDVTVSTTLLEVPDALPQIKLQSMNEKLLLIRNLRDIGMGMMDLRQ